MAGAALDGKDTGVGNYFLLPGHVKAFNFTTETPKLNKNTPAREGQKVLSLSVHQQSKKKKEEKS